MTICTLSFTAQARGQVLGLRVLVDNVVVADTMVSREPVTVTHDFEDAEQEHTLCIELLGKTSQHTQVDIDGNIVEDSVLEIQDLSLDGIALGQIFYDKAEYHHDFNGSGPTVVEGFYGIMGCNGQVLLKFTSPIYLWLLENF
jgi:hypothetical protein